MITKTQIHRFLKLSVKDKMWIALRIVFGELLLGAYQRRFNFSGSYRLIRGSRHKSTTLILIVAGYKDDLWDRVFPRIAQFAPKDAHVCILTPGKEDSRLIQLAKTHKWSYLSTAENKLSLAQNIAIKIFPHADFVYKLDEDIFVTRHYFSGLKKTWEKIQRDGAFDPGVIVPVLNVNGATYRDILVHRGKLSAYKKRFGEAKSACMGIPAHVDPEASHMIWEITGNIDEIALELHKNKRDGYRPVPHRFSIGAIAFSRSFWDEIGGFKTAPEGFFGVEEEDLAVQTYSRSRPMMIAEGIVAGHFCFGPQYPIMIQKLQSGKLPMIQ